MGRQKRSYHPGLIFHLFSRTHRREPWFVPELRTVIVELIQSMVARTDAQLLAYAVMPNHLHIVLRQGRMELAEVMQPLMRRVALRVQHLHGLEGSVMERRYRDRSCTTPDYVRTAIVYTHLNPWRAGLCNDDLAYSWTSHAAYLPGADPIQFGIHPEAQERALGLFADQPHLIRDELAERYRALLESRMRQDRYLKALDAGLPAEPPPPAPTTIVGDQAWQHLITSNEVYAAGEHQPVPDLRDFIKDLIPSYSPGTKIAEFRGPRRPRSISRVRARLIRAATDRGFRTGEIARFFAISPQLVSRTKYSAPG